MSFDVVKADLNYIYARDPENQPSRTHLTGDDVQRWATLTDTSQDVLCDQIGLYLAQGFQDSELTFAFCDAIVNDIFGLITSWQTKWPDLFWKVYLAFDEGEYYHGSNRDEDPVEVYTRPRIAQIVADHRQSA